MKLLELEICNFRGIKYLKLTPQGRNFLIQGPNGSGKSSVVDALDFLLTGRITRLTGRGTGDLSLEDHGPHVDAGTGNSWVRGRFQLAGRHESVTIKRQLNRPSELEYEAGVADDVEQALRTARNGLHLLTRRNMLQYIAAESSTRAQQIQQLLDLSPLESARTALVRVENELDGEEKAARERLTRARGTLAATVGKPTYDATVILDVVNQCRRTLGGATVSILDPSRLKEGIKPPGMARETPPISRQVAEQCLINLRSVLTREFQEDIGSLDKDIKELISRVDEVPAFRERLRRTELLQLGLELIDETGACPLCEYQWPPGELRRKLEERLKELKELQELVERAGSASMTLRERMESLGSSIEQLVAILQRLSNVELASIFQEWLQRIRLFCENLIEQNVLSYAEVAASTDEIRSGFAPPDIERVLDMTQAAVRDGVPEIPPDQQAWDLLTRIEENLKSVIEAERDYRMRQLWRERASVLRSLFETIRDRTLAELYDSVRDEFVSLYRSLHDEDEGGFTAQLMPRGSGLDFRVDFYGRGLYPPHALHSEGHQDTMGLCLFLALNRRLGRGSLDLTMLDDVIMSVDRDHRRKVCKLLSRLFSDGQVLLTTHDSTWARQLITEGVVQPQDTVYFRGWDINTGPQVGVDERDVWFVINQHLDRNDVRAAAAQLRWYLEMFYSNACELLRAHVLYKPDGRWELGDLLPAAYTQLKQWLTKAERAARSWGRTQEAERIAEARSVLEQSYKRSRAEEWSVNPNVHYQAWVEFAPADLRPVVEAFHDLEGSFRCATCESMLSVAERDKKPVAIKCRCAGINWSLEARA